jgi:hypothetical protein
LTRRRATATVLVIIAVSAAAGLAALVATRSPTHHTTTPVPTRTGPRTQLYTGPAHTFRYPAGWRVVEAERPESGGAFFRTTLASPGGTETIDVDRTPHQTLSPGRQAAAVEGATARTAGYEPISFSATTLAGRSAVVWEFRLNGHAHPARIDIFQNVGSSGYAVYGLADTAAAVAPTALAVAESLTAR